MRLIKPYFEIITPINGEQILNQIELAARTCYKSEDRIAPGSAEKLIKNVLMARGHNAMLEFGGMITVKFVCDRGVSHELVRHRLASFAQESTRFCNYTDDKFSNGEVTFIIPCWLNIPEGQYVWWDGDYCDVSKMEIMVSNEQMKEDTKLNSFLVALDQCESSYKMMVNTGWTPQQARAVLPNSLKTEINMSANIREWREIFRQRTANAAHPQMQELMRPLLKEFQNRISILFDDITY